MEKRFSLAGWLLFMVCAGFFIASAVKSGDTWYLIGSLIFLGACVIFIIPLITGRSRSKDR
ncbi:MAG: cytochrome oxidase subunit III [Dehalococcoidia bacterium]